MVANNIKTFPNINYESWLSIEKFIIKCRKVLQNNVQAYINPIFMEEEVNVTPFQKKC